MKLYIAIDSQVQTMKRNRARDGVTPTIGRKCVRPGKATRISSSIWTRHLDSVQQAVLRVFAGVIIRSQVRKATRAANGFDFSYPSRAALLLMMRASQAKMSLGVTKAAR